MLHFSYFTKKCCIESKATLYKGRENFCIEMYVDLEYQGLRAWRAFNSIKGMKNHKSTKCITPAKVHGKTYYLKLMWSIVDIVADRIIKWATSDTNLQILKRYISWNLLSRALFWQHISKWLYAMRGSIALVMGEILYRVKCRLYRVSYQVPWSAYLRFYGVRRGNL